MRKCDTMLVATVAALLCVIHVSDCDYFGRQGELAKATTGCPSPCNCTSYTATCSSLRFDRDQLPPHVSGLKLIAPLEPLALSHRAFANLGMKSLVSLMISDATITQLDKAAFDGLPSLSTVSILNSIMPPIDARTFATSSKMKTLDLSGSEILEFQPIVSDTIEELIMERCKLNHVTDKMFEHLPSLTYMNLARNNIQEIDTDAFVQQEDLEELILHHNKLANVSFELFSKNLFLSSLDLSYNPIANVEFSDEIDLEKLTLTSCQLTEFVGGPSSLSYLDIRNNNIKFINITNMIELQYLYVAHNNISNIGENTFEYNAELITLILDDNPIGKLTRFKNLRNEHFMIKTLSCRNCGLANLDPFTFQTLSALNSLDLSNNKLVDLQENVFAPLTSLTILKLAKNRINDLHIGTLSKNILLRKLDLSENEILTLDCEAFRHNSRLELLDLSYGQLEQLWRTPVDTKLKIIAINAASNPLKNLTLEELQVTPDLEVLDIDNVLVPCTQLKELLPYLKNNKIGPTIIKTHEDTIDASMDDYDDNHYKSWDEYSKSKGCGDLDSQEDENEVEDGANKYNPLDVFEDDDIDGDGDFAAYNNGDNEVIAQANPWSDDNDAAGYSNDISIDDDGEMGASGDADSIPLDYDMHIIRAIEHDRFAASSYNRFTFFWPTLVFLFTSLLVLTVAVNVILLVLRKRGALSRNVPQLKNSWGNSNRLLTKRHCGSIYRPLTEDLTGPKTPIFARSLLFMHPSDDKNATLAVHNV